MIPWPYMWWVAYYQFESAPMRPPDTPHGPPQERTQLNETESNAFSELEATFWQGGGRHGRTRTQLIVARCYLLARLAIVGALVLGLATVVLALLSGVWAIPGIIALTGWLVVLAARPPGRRRHRPPPPAGRVVPHPRRAP